MVHVFVMIFKSICCYILQPLPNEKLKEQTDRGKHVESDGNKVTNEHIKTKTQNRATRTSLSKSPLQSTRPQLFTLFTKPPLNQSDTKKTQISNSSMHVVSPSTAVPIVITSSNTHGTCCDTTGTSSATVTSPGKGHVVPSVQNIQLPVVPPGGQTAQMLQLEDGSSIVLPDRLEVGQEILVYVEKPPGTVTEESVEEKQSAQEKGSTKEEVDKESTETQDKP